MQRDVGRLKKTFERSAPVLHGLLLRTTYADLDGLFTSYEVSGGMRPPMRPPMRPLQKGGMHSSRTIYGQQLVDSVLAAISKPVSSQLELERANRGGRKPDLYRNYLIQELGRSCPAILGRNATTTKSGRFVMLCEWVIDAVGYDSTGVDKAVPRILKNADLIAASPRKQSKKA